LFRRTTKTTSPLPQDPSAATPTEEAPPARRPRSFEPRKTRRKKHGASPIRRDRRKQRTCKHAELTNRQDREETKRSRKHRGTRTSRGRKQQRESGKAEKRLTKKETDRPWHPKLNGIGMQQARTEETPPTNRTKRPERPRPWSEAEGKTSKREPFEQPHRTTWEHQPTRTSETNPLGGPAGRTLVPSPNRVKKKMTRRVDRGLHRVKAA
jgi:hypothetical protein